MDPSILGILLSLLAAVGFGLFAVFARPAMLHASFSVGVMVSAAMGILVIAILAIVFDSSALVKVGPLDLGWIAFIGLMNLALGRLFNLNSIRRIGVSRAAPLLGATPMVAAILALVIYQETIGLLLGLGIVLVVAGVVLIMRETG